MQTSTLSSAALQTGIMALQHQQYATAIGLLEAFCHDCAIETRTDSTDYFRARMHLVEIYERQEQLERALLLCHSLRHCTNAQVQIWAQRKLTGLTNAKPAQTQQSQTCTSAPEADFQTGSETKPRFAASSFLFRGLKRVFRVA